LGFEVVEKLHSLVSSETKKGSRWNMVGGLLPNSLRFFALRNFISLMPLIRFHITW